jgi:hypothetical protein
MTITELLPLARALSDEEKRQLVDELAHDLREEPLDRATVAEIERRVAHDIANPHDVVSEDEYQTFIQSRYGHLL